MFWPTRGRFLTPQSLALVATGTVLLVHCLTAFAQMASAGAPPSAALGVAVPIGVALDSSDRLYVADRDFSRVLSWSDAGSFGTGQNPDLVIGQTGVTTDHQDSGSTLICRSGAAALCWPTAGALVTSGDLFVADTANSLLAVSWHRPHRQLCPFQQCAYMAQGDH
jgi:hypothetical protein